jgi:hypothetical protein
MIDACQRATRRALACLVGVVLACGVLAEPPPALAAPAAGVTITVAAITPSFPSPGSAPLTLSGEAVNTGKHAVALGQVQLWLDRTRLTSRGALADALKPGARDGAPVNGAQVKLDGTLAPGARVGWQLVVPTKTLGLRQNGVYPMSVVAVDDNGDRLGAATTALPWMAEGKDYAPTRIAVLWPLADQPRMTGEGKVNQDGTLSDPVLTDDGLAGSLSGLAGDQVGAGAASAGPNAGRLARLLAAGLAAQTQDHVPLTWAVDPDLLATVRAMTGPYQVRANGKGGTGQDAARTWLAAVKRAASDAGTVLSLPYADQDVSAIAHAALRKPRVDLRSDLTAARTIGGDVSTTVLGRPVTTDVAWPGSATADAGVLTALRGAGYSQVILGDTTAPAADDPPFTPGGTARLDGLTAQVTDTALDQVLAGDSRAPGAAALLTQRFLAETAMITEEAPNSPRTILVAPPRDWDPDPTFVTGLLGALGHAPWLTPVGLGATSPGSSASRAHQLRPQPDAGALTASQLSGLAGAHGQINQLASILAGPPTKLTGPYQPAILRAESISWRGRAAAAADFRDTVDANLRALHNRVGINTAATLTLSGNSGSLPFTVVNDLEQPVSVKLRVVSLNTTRLDVDETQPLVVAGGGRAQVKINVRNVVGPRVRIRAQLLTRAGQEYGPAQQLTVVSTNFGAIGLGIIFGAVALILVVVAVRLRRRARGRARPAPDPAPGPVEPEEPALGDGCVPDRPDPVPPSTSDEKLTR